MPRRMSDYEIRRQSALRESPPDTGPVIEGGPWRGYDEATWIAKLLRGGRLPESSADDGPENSPHHVALTS